ncbi:MAG: 4'-phosphopantetheinyl transferase superfamily protein, partial [Burkholderiales bacterium]|nr:4'-phosphopantetheinyl transferase superfamily protein [Burkholderiales bacterium]
PELRARYIVGRATLRALLGGELDMAPQDVTIGRGRRGRPQLPGHDLDFNVSHTAGVALFGMTRTRRIGVDIEHGERALNVEGVARKFMTARERTMLAALDPDPRRRALLRLWTCKEAMSKATGDALSAPFRRLDVDLDGLRLADGPAPYAPARMRLVPVEVPDGFLATAALWHEQDPPAAL